MKGCLRGTTRGLTRHRLPTRLRTTLRETTLYETGRVESPENWRTRLRREGEAPSVVALGKFDALHVGHRALAAAAAQLGHPWLISFRNMARVMGWDENRLPLVATCERPYILGSWKEACAGRLPHMRYLPFNEIRHQSPRAFVEFLVRELGVVGIVAGANYRFGYKAKGDAAELRSLGEELGIQVKIVELVGSQQNGHLGNVSSSKVREALANGDFSTVQALLGRRYTLVVNLADRTDPRLIPAAGFLNQPPRNGVYRALVDSIPADVEFVDNGVWSSAFEGLENVGLRHAMCSAMQRQKCPVKAKAMANKKGSIQQTVAARVSSNHRTAASKPTAPKRAVATTTVSRTPLLKSNRSRQTGTVSPRTAHAFGRSLTTDPLRSALSKSPIHRSTSKSETPRKAVRPLVTKRKEGLRKKTEQLGATPQLRKKKISNAAQKQPQTQPEGTKERAVKKLTIKRAIPASCSATTRDPKTSRIPLTPCMNTRPKTTRAHKPKLASSSRTLRLKKDKTSGETTTTLLQICQTMQRNIDVDESNICTSDSSRSEFIDQCLTFSRECDEATGRADRLLEELSFMRGQSIGVTNRRSTPTAWSQIETSANRRSRTKRCARKIAKGDRLCGTSTRESLMDSPIDTMKLGTCGFQRAWPKSLSMSGGTESSDSAAGDSSSVSETTPSPGPWMQALTEKTTTNLETPLHEELRNCLKRMASLELENRALKELLMRKSGISSDVGIGKLLNGSTTLYTDPQSHPPLSHFRSLRSLFSRSSEEKIRGESDSGFGIRTKVMKRMTRWWVKKHSKGSQWSQ